MKKLMLFVACIFILNVCTTSCVSYKRTASGKSGKIPPGQAKKITGSQSAKPYAPGQQKKHNH
ncbi:hypothetical protein ACG2LH_01735 [Zhouia sp. PK063]|uniref:hypothetical protein n=1 Tax=Zhouia sp. PK063 TaxID=3373602 RepID=UPI00379A58F3